MFSVCVFIYATRSPRKQVLRERTPSRLSELLVHISKMVSPKTMKSLFPHLKVCVHVIRSA